jgi:hypothetical protein
MARDGFETALSLEQGEKLLESLESSFVTVISAMLLENSFSSAWKTTFGSWLCWRMRHTFCSLWVSL